MMTRFAMTMMVLFAIAMPAMADTIFMKGAKALAGVTVRKETYLTVEYTVGKGARRLKVDAWLVSGILYDNQSRAYRRGVEFFSVSDWSNAAAQLEVAIAEKDGAAQPWLVEYANVYLGRSYLALSRHTEAAAAFSAALADNLESRLYAVAKLGAARAMIGAGDYAKADALLDEAVGVLDGNKVGGDGSLVLKLVKGDVLAARREFGKAVSFYRGFAPQLKPSDPIKEPARQTLYVKCKRLEAQANIGGGNSGKARLVFLEIASASGSAAQAASRNGLAELDILEDKNLEAAALQLARTNVENHDAVSEIPRTCYLLGRVHLKLQGSVSDARRLAKSYFEETIRRFPESPEAALAHDQLKQL